MKSFVCVRSLTLMILVITSHFLGSCQTKRSKSPSSTTENISPQASGNSSNVSADKDSYQSIADSLNAAITKYNQNQSSSGPSTTQTLPAPSDPQKLADSIEQNGETAAALTHVALAEQGTSTSTDSTGSTGGMMWLPFISNTHLEEIGIGASVAAVALAVGLVAVGQYKYWKVRQIFQADKKNLADAEASLTSAITAQKSDPAFLAEQAAQAAKIAEAQANVDRLATHATGKTAELAAARKQLDDLTAAQKQLQADYAAKGRLVIEAKAVVVDAQAAVEQALAAFTALSNNDSALDRDILDHEAQATAAKEAAATIEGKVQPLTDAEKAAETIFKQLQAQKVRTLAEQRERVEAAQKKAIETRDEERKLRQLIHPAAQAEIDAKEGLPRAGWFEWITGARPERAALLAQVQEAGTAAEKAWQTYDEAKKRADAASEEFGKVDAAATEANKLAEVAALRGQGALASLSRQVAAAKEAVERAKANLITIEQAIAEKRTTSAALKARVKADTARVEALKQDLAAKRAKEVELHRDQVAADTAQGDAQTRTAAQAAKVDSIAREKAFADKEQGLAADQLAAEQKIKPKAASAGVDAAQANKDTLAAKEAQSSKLLSSQKKSALGFGIAGALFGTVGVAMLVSAAVAMSQNKTNDGLELAAQNDAQTSLLADLKDLELRWQRLYGRKILEAQAAQQK